MATNCDSLAPCKHGAPVCARAVSPVLEREQARRLFASLEQSAGLVELRDRAILAVMLYDFVRVGAVVRMRARDFEEQGTAAWLLLREKGGKERRIPAHPVVRDAVSAYLAAGGLRGREHARVPLFQSAPGHAKSLSGKPLDRSAVLGIVKRRCRAVDLPSSICNHSFRGNRSADGLGWSLTSGAGARATGGLVRGAGGLRELGADRYAPDGCQRQGISSASRAAGCD